MEIKIYLDTYFLVNLIFDAILLSITGLLLRQPSKKGRLLLSAIIGALYAVCAFFFPGIPVITLLGKLSVGAGMVFLTFRPACLRAYIKYLSVFYAVVFIYGGLALAFFYRTESAADFGTILQNGLVYTPLPTPVLLMLSGFAWAILKTAFSIGAAISARGKDIISLEIFYRGRTLSIRGFHDSGNLLRKEPEGQGIIICGWDTIKPLFRSLKNLDELIRTEKGICLVPYNTLSGSGQLPCFFPDAVYIIKGRCLFRTEEVWIGITSENPDYYHNWDAILPHDFKGVENYEKKLDSKVLEIFRLEEKKAGQLVLKKRYPRSLHRR